MKLHTLAFLAFLLQFSAARAQTAISVQGEVGHPLVLKASDLASMKRVTVVVRDEQGASQSYSGVALADILGAADVPMGKQLRGKNMAKYLLVKAGDGYSVLFSLPELDTVFSDKIIFLADQLNGKPLPVGKGPFQIIVPGEKRHARWIWDVRMLTVGFAKES